MEYKLDFNLQQRAALKIATTFWKRKEVKDKAAEFFKSCDKFESGEIRRQWAEFTETIVKEWNEDVLPQKLEAELIHLVKMIGETIFNWHLYIKHEYTGEEAINCLDEIKWTPYGTVDAVKILKSSWLNNPHLDITKVYNFACRYAVEEHINELWDKIPRNVQDDHYKDIYKYYNQHILAYWKSCKDNDLPNLMRYCQIASNYNNKEDRQFFFSPKDFYEFLYSLTGSTEENRIADMYTILYDLSRSTDENMLRLTVYQGHFVAMKYFWEKLTEEEKDESIFKCVRIAASLWNRYESEYDSIGDYKRSQCVEICVFLMNQMTSRDKKLFYKEEWKLEICFPEWDHFDVKDRILSMLLFTWPWGELFVSVLEDMLHYVDDDSKMDCKLDAITFYLCEDYKLGYSLEASKYRFLLREVWFIIPAHFKRRIPQVNPKSVFINNLIDVWDLDSLNLIINDPEIAAVRGQFIDFGCNSYNQFVVNDQFEKLDQLIKEIFQFDGEEKKSFKQKINPWSDIFKNHRFDLADKFLDCQSSTPEERQFLKNNINHMELCKEFINYCDFESFDKFLDWKFESIEERIVCKEHFKTDIFALKQVFHVWARLKGDIDDAKQRSSRFLDWVFESKEERRRFKREKLAIRQVDESILDDLYFMQIFGLIEEFVTWCILDD